MPLIEYLNPNNHSVHLVGPDKSKITVGPNQKVTLSDWYSRYSPKYIKFIKYANTTATSTIKPKNVTQKMLGKSAVGIRKPNINKDRTTPRSLINPKRTTVVGKRTPGNPQLLFENISKHAEFTFSNNIGVGILSYNRLGSLQRLIGSIRKYANYATTIFVSDDCSSTEVTNWLARQPNIILVKNDIRLGVAGNSNRLLRCLSRFKYKIILNDDVEILRHGWENFYVEKSAATGIHHFCYRQTGIYGADHGSISTINNVKISTVYDKPHGAVMWFDDVAFNTVGYFDENYGIYGMEHVDWSNRVSVSGIQPRGYHDALDSEAYFLIHNEKSSVAPDERSVGLQFGKTKFASDSTSNRIFCAPSEKSVVPSVSVVIPYRNTFRNEDLKTVISNIRAMKYPNIEIIVAEQDSDSKIPDLSPIRHILVPSIGDQHFNKSKAFNVGVCKALYDNVILHDADMITKPDYIELVIAKLKTYDSAHIGKNVYYLDSPSSKIINETLKWNPHYKCERIVEYYEGGSLGIKKSAYFNIGGFNEEYVGYGCEDCCFFKRMKELTNCFNERSINLFHLHHGRVPGWDVCHKNNKALYDKSFSLGTAKYAENLSNVLRHKYGI